MPRSEHAIPGNVDPSRFNLVREIFLDAQRFRGHARRAFLKQRCQGDSDLLAQVVDLLKHDESDSSVLDKPLVQMDRPVDKPSTRMLRRPQTVKEIGPLPEAPRTTCVACIVQDSIAYWAHAGDSRLYALRGGRVIGQTRDHSRVQRMLEDGLITSEDATHHPARNRIFSCLGGVSPPHIDYSKKTPLMTGDILLLCSDGVWGPLPKDVIPRAMSTGNVLQATPALMNQAEARGGANADNLSMIAIRWEDNYAEDTLGSVSTKTMPVDSFTTQMEAFAKARKGAQPLPNLSDEDIERAIQEINTAIKKYSK